MRLIQELQHRSSCRRPTSECGGLIHPPTYPSKLKFKTYTGQPIPHLGVLYVDIAAEGQRARARLVIAKGYGPSILGWDWLCKIRLNWHGIKYAHKTATKETILLMYNDICRDKPGH